MNITKYRMKKSCKGCKACVSGLDGYCDLGYETQGKFDDNMLAYMRRPLEVCPKPMTNARWVEEMQMQQQILEYRKKLKVSED